jgi:hypothetical protein
MTITIRKQYVQVVKHCLKVPVIGSQRQLHQCDIRMQWLRVRYVCEHKNNDYLKKKLYIVGW